MLIDEKLQQRSWISFFSQTGQELCELIQLLDWQPDVIVTNRSFSKVADISDSLRNVYKGLWVFTPSKSSVLNYEQAIRCHLNPNPPIITLHGWLRVIPEEICKYEIWNGHPGLITTYPELKGKDPQNKVIANLSLYSKIGSVIHRVTPGVDEGKVCVEVSTLNTCTTPDSVYSTLRTTSLKAWEEFFKNYSSIITEPIGITI